jgi:signal transduction histidine kinase
MPLPFHRFVRARLHRRIFVWFGLSILLTASIVGLVMQVTSWTSGGGGWKRDMERIDGYVAARFAEAWADPRTRDAFAATMAHDLDVDIVLLDAARAPLATFGTAACTRPGRSIPIARGGAVVGYANICFDRHFRIQPWRAVLPILLAGVILWAMSGKIARRLARPLGHIANVAKDIGAGRLQSRANLGRHQPGEVGVLADAINDMAARIERQLADQRELLAGVSHELRTPLTRMRLLVELMRTREPDARELDELEREIVEVDVLVGELLAGARLDFATLAPRPLDAVESARRALERAGADAALLAVEAPDPAATAFQGDATLVARALANLVDNAKRHGGGMRALRVRAGDAANGAPATVAFEVEDGGSGFAPGDEARVFDPFYRRPDGPEGDPRSLGLGLALVKRIAEAHGGRAYAHNRAGGGALVGFELPVSRT